MRMLCNFTTLFQGWKIPFQFYVAVAKSLRYTLLVVNDMLHIYTRI